MFKMVNKKSIYNLLLRLPKVTSFTKGNFVYIFGLDLKYNATILCPVKTVENCSLT